MAHPAQHSIHTLRFELNSDDKELALRLQNEVSEMMQNELPAMLEQTLNEAELSRVHVFFQKISVQLDPIAPGQFKNEIRRQLPSALARELSKLITKANLDQVHRHEVRTSDEKEYAADMLARFLITGIWPGAELAPGRSPAEWLKYMLKHSPDSIPVLMQQIKSHYTKAAARLASIISPSEFVQIISLTEKPGRSQIYIELFQSMDRAIRQLALKVDVNALGWQAASTRFILQSLLIHLNVVKPAESPVIEMLGSFAAFIKAPSGLFKATPKGQVSIHPRVKQVLEARTSAMSWKQATEKLFFLADEEGDDTSQFVVVRSPKAPRAHRDDPKSSQDTEKSPRETISVVPGLSPEERDDILAQSIRLSKGMATAMSAAEIQSISGLLSTFFPGLSLSLPGKEATRDWKFRDLPPGQLTLDAVKRLVIWMRTETVKEFKPAMDDPSVSLLIEWRTALLVDRLMEKLPAPLLDAVLSELFPAQLRLIRYLDAALGAVMEPLKLPETRSNLKRVLLLQFIQGVPSGSAASARYAVYRAMADLFPDELVVPALQAMARFGEAPATPTSQEMPHSGAPFLPVLKKFADQWPTSIAAYHPDTIERLGAGREDREALAEIIRKGLPKKTTQKSGVKTQVAIQLQVLMRELALRPSTQELLAPVLRKKASAPSEPTFQKPEQLETELSLLAKFFPRGTFKQFLSALIAAKGNEITDPKALYEKFLKGFSALPTAEVSEAALQALKPAVQKPVETTQTGMDEPLIAEPVVEREPGPQNDIKKEKELEAQSLPPDKIQKETAPVSDETAKEVTVKATETTDADPLRRAVFEALKDRVQTAEWVLDWLRDSLNLPLKSLAELSDDQAKALFTVYVAEGEIPAELMLEGITATRDAVIEWLNSIVHAGHSWLYPILVKTTSVTAAIRRLAEALDSRGMMQVYRILSGNKAELMKHITHFDALQHVNTLGIEDRIILVKSLMMAAINPKGEPMEYVPFLRMHLRIAEMEFDRPAAEWFAWWKQIEIPEEWNAREFKASLEILRRQVSERKVRPDFNKTGQQDAESTRTVMLEEKITIDNAGLVLLNPFIPHLFKMSGLLDDKRQFISEQHAWEGIKMLHFAVTNQKNTPEHAILLSKVICGMPADWLPPDNADLDEKHVELIDSMLQAVIEQWKALGKSSIENLRGSFLFRRGLLHEDELKWNLTVEQKSWDLLLDKVPWTFGMLKFPWMTKRLQVTWR